jgi:Na+-translocating ferredoxin:NAD+ oxidoreductase RnfG subunit
MFRKMLLALLLVSGVAVAQRGKDKNPVLHEVSNKDIVQSVYPNAVKVEKVNDYWFRILNEKDKTIGFAMSSVPFCKDVKGYNDLTPVMILVDKDKTIKKVALLSNWETQRFVAKLETNRFFDSWVGKKLKDAQNLQVDSHTGATFTASAVAKNVEFLLSTAVKNLPKWK